MRKQVERNSTKLNQKIRGLQAGTTQHLTGGLQVMRTAMTQSQILAKLATLERLYAAVEAARATEKWALAAYDAAVPGARLFIANYEAALKAQFGVDSPKLRDFGLRAVGSKPRARGAMKRRVTRYVRYRPARTLGEARAALAGRTDREG